MNRENDPLRVCSYDPAWPHRFSVLADRVKAHLGARVIRVEHIGGTAVPGLSAKPIIDLDVVLTSPADRPDVIRRLATLGYVHEGDLGIGGRDAFRWPPGEVRHHLYVLAADAPELRRHLAFRDALRADRALRVAYGELKTRLACRYSDDRRAYSDAKTAFVTETLHAT